MSSAPFSQTWQRWLTALSVAGLLSLLAQQIDWPFARLLQFALEAIVVALALQLRAKSQPALQPAWDALAVGLFIWLVSNLLTALLEAFTRSTSLAPSIIDLIRLVGYPLLAFGLWRYPMGARNRATRLRVLLDLLLAVGCAAAIIYDLSLRPLLATAQATFTEPAIIIWQAVYPFAALLLTLAAVAVILRAPPAGLHASLIIVAVGLITAVNFSPALGQIIIGLGALLVGAGAWPGLDLPRLGSRRTRLIQIAQRFLPVLAVLTLFVETISLQFVTSQADATSLYLAILFSALLVVRQGVLLGETDLQQYAQLVNSTTDAAFVCKEDGRLLLANPVTYNLLGLQPGDELGNRTLADLFQPLPPASVGEILVLARTGSWQGEGSAKTGSRPITLALSLNTLRDEAGIVAGLVGVGRDVTERKHMESKLRSLNAQLLEAQDRLMRANADLELKVTERTANLESANRQLEQQNAELQTLDELKSEFISLVSHELRAPLTNLNGGLELMLTRDKEMSLKSREALTLMSREARRLTKIVETILDISAFEAGQLPIKIAPLSLNSLLPSVVEQFLSNPNVDRLNLNLPPDLPPVLGDERGLRSVLFQLIDNAFKYAPESPVEISAHCNDTMIQIRVSDHGPGIPSDQQGKVFGKFHRAQQSDSQKVYGYGLGLHTSRRFMDAMEGSIALENTPGGGATFCVSLRRANL
ncbi:MAG: PAS domain-containing protein [Chloroflexi bacterium]|nr:PAS domain-containing protein [Chloroflexota bacterium]